MKIQQFLAPIIATGLSLIPELVYAAPIQCYIGKSGAYRICDMQRKGESQYLIVWPDGDKTAVIVVSTPSGSYANVGHAYSNGRIYAKSTRYPRFHYKRGKWLCLHQKPGGRGKIDFCIRV